jgi:phosphoglucosamine mutase
MCSFRKLSCKNLRMRMGKYFGTDGIRGEANVGAMSPAMVLKIGQAFGLMLREKHARPKVIIGKDTRVSGYMLEGILSAGLCSVGVDVLFLGPLPTPGVAYLTRGMRATAGIMISASHNPFHDNGIKLFDRNGYKFPDADESLIEKLMDDPNLENRLIASADIGRAKRIDDAIGQYAVFLKERFPKAFQLDGMRIVIDCANGAGYRVAPKVFSELGAEVFCINDDPNGFNINLDSGALHPEKLQEEVLRYRADIGLALDGDADRLLIVDERGHLLDGDQIIAMCALAMKAEGQLVGNKVVVTVMSNMGLDLAMRENGIDVIRTSVGDRHVVEEMRRQGLVLGGEQSGHLLLKLPQVTRNVKVLSRPPLSELPEFQAEVSKVEKHLAGAGRVLVRYSGTETLARITVEGPELVLIKQMSLDLEKHLVSSIAAHVAKNSDGNSAGGAKKKG